MGSVDSVLLVLFVRGFLNSLARDADSKPTRKGYSERWFLTTVKLDVCSNER
jgi:hypothetical protein